MDRSERAWTSFLNKKSLPYPPFPGHGQHSTSQQMLFTWLQSSSNIWLFNRNTRLPAYWPLLIRLNALPKPNRNVFCYLLLHQRPSIWNVIASTHNTGEYFQDSTKYEHPQIHLSYLKSNPNPQSKIPTI